MPVVARQQPRRRCRRVGRDPLNAAGDLDAALVQLGDAAGARQRLGRRASGSAHGEALARNLRPAEAAFSSFHVLDALREQAAGDGILAYDVGAHTHQIATQWRTDVPDTCISTNGWSSMGYGIPAAYAAKLVHPERTVVGVIGDGCFQMTAGELALGAAPRASRRRSSSSTTAGSA